jgi:hypothetical protein
MVSSSRGNLSHVSCGANPSRIMHRASFDVSPQLRASNIKVPDNIDCLDTLYEGAFSWGETARGSGDVIFRAWSCDQGYSDLGLPASKRWALRST